MSNQGYTYRYPHPCVTTDCVIFGFDGQALHLLLVERGREPFKGYWALPGGFLEEGETLEQCAARELEEETHLKGCYFEQIHAFSDPLRDTSRESRVITVPFVALVPIAPVQGDDDAAKAKWFPVDALPQPLAFDHADILLAAACRLHERLRLYPVSSLASTATFSTDQWDTLKQQIESLPDK